MSTMFKYVDFHISDNCSEFLGMNCVKSLEMFPNTVHIQKSATMIYDGWNP